MHRRSKVVVIVFTILLVIKTAAPVPAFPGAEGFGAGAKGGRSGKVPDDPWSLVIYNRLSAEEIESYKQSSPISVPRVKTDDAITTFERVLTDAGAVCPRRDAVDNRIVSEVRNGTGKIINDEEQVGGWPELKSAEPLEDSDRDGMPDAWERRHGFDVNDPADRNGDADGDGYTNLEDYLNALN